MSDRIDNYPAMIALASDIGVELSKRGFQKNKCTYKVRRENYHSSYIRFSQDDLFVHVASVAVYCPLPQVSDDIYLAPMAAQIEAGVEFRAAIPELYRPIGARDERNLSSTDCTFKVPELQIEKAIADMKNSAFFATDKLRALTMLPTSSDKAERIEELMRFFGLFTDFFFSQFTSDFPFSQISVTDIEELHCSRANKFSSLFEASAFSLAGAAESYWKQNGDFVQAQKFKELRRRIFNDPLSVVCSFPPAK